MSFCTACAGFHIYLKKNLLRPNWEMGRTFRFHCTQCQYHADISGGVDSGLNCDVQTILCRECRELYDVFTRVRRAVGCRDPVPELFRLHAAGNSAGDLARQFVRPESRRTAPI